MRLCSGRSFGQKGGEGGIALAEKVIETIETKPSNYAPLYPDDMPIKEKIETVAKKIYGADGVTYSLEAEKAIANIEKLGWGLSGMYGKNTVFLIG